VDAKSPRTRCRFTPTAYLDLMHTVDRNTPSSPTMRAARDQMPFGKAPLLITSAGARPRSFGMGLGLAMGAKLAKPEKLCINVMGDAAIGFTGMDFETATRERIPILTIVLITSPWHVSWGS